MQSCQSQESGNNLGFPYGKQGPKYLSCYLLSPKVQISRYLKLEVELGLKPMHFSVVFRHYDWNLNHQTRCSLLTNLHSAHAHTKSQLCTTAKRRLGNNCPFTPSWIFLPQSRPSLSMPHGAPGQPGSSHSFLVARSFVGHHIQQHLIPWACDMTAAGGMFTGVSQGTVRVSLFLNGDTRQGCARSCYKALEAMT